MKCKRTLRSILWFIPFLFSSFYGGEDTDINVYLRYDCFYCRSNFGKDQILLRNKSVIRNDSFIWTKDVTLKSALILILFFPTKRLRTLFWMLWTKPMGTFEKRKKKCSWCFKSLEGKWRGPWSETKEIVCLKVTIKTTSNADQCYIHCYTSAGSR